MALADLDHVVSEGQGERLELRVHAELREDVVDVVARCVDGDVYASGHNGSVIHARQAFLETMRVDLISAGEGLHSRHVTALMADVSLEPDMAGHIFVLDRPIQTRLT